jgi:hypothetical protein
MDVDEAGYAFLVIVSGALIFYWYLTMGGCL